KLESRKQKAEIISVFSFRLAPVPTLNYPRAPRHPFTEGEFSLHLCVKNQTKAPPNRRAPVRACDMGDNPLCS
ncbi:MAG: hypothetical protein LBK60_02630, partial [Verrucomicrobiales bacterium]|nr:hypothetical protein [Verrucomicrobiales bacterium]